MNARGLRHSGRTRETRTSSGPRRSRGPRVAEMRPGNDRLGPECRRLAGGHVGMCPAQQQGGGHSNRSAALGSFAGRLPAGRQLSVGPGSERSGAVTRVGGRGPGARDSLVPVFLGWLPAGRPRGRFCAMITPLSKISPPQTPQASPRSSAPARHGRRSGHRRQAALASSRSAGTSENHSHELWAHGSGPLISAARRTSTASEVAVLTDPIWLIGGPPPERAQQLADAPLDSCGSGR